MSKTSAPAPPRSGNRRGHIQVASALRPAKMTTERSAASGLGPAATIAVRG